MAKPTPGHSGVGGNPAVGPRPSGALSGHSSKTAQSGQVFARRDILDAHARDYRIYILEPLVDARRSIGCG
jgi:hypothetical protein